jgi:hypothetical protein
MRFASALAVSILAATGAAAQAPRVYYYCDTWGTYHPWVRTCPVPWRAVNAMPASPPPDTAAPSPAGAAERPAAPAQTKPARAAPSAARPAAANAAQFAQGLRDRTAWEGAGACLSAGSTSTKNAAPAAISGYAKSELNKRPLMAAGPPAVRQHAAEEDGALGRGYHCD